MAEAGISRYVQPYVAIIDTKTWTWKTTFRGGELSDIWDHSIHTDNDHGGLSNGAKVGIGIAALAAMALFGAGALYCFRRRKNRTYFSTTPSFALPTVEKETKGSTPRATTKESRSSIIEPESSIELHPSRSHSPYSTPRLHISTRATRTSGEESLSAQTATGVESQHLSVLTPSLSFTSTAPSTHIRQSPQLYNNHTSSDKSFSSIPLQSVRIGITNQDSESSATNSTVTVTRVNTVHTPILTPAREFDAKLLNGPQSVPESDAFIERSSPGVRTHFVGPQDLDSDGLYPPLTPTTQYASSSIVIGVPPHLSSTISDGSMPGSWRYHEGGSSSMSGSPSVHSPSRSMSYRNTQKEQDLSAIIQRIESQGRMELQSPHAVVQSEPRIEEHKVEVDEKGKQVSAS